MLNKIHPVFLGLVWFLCCIWLSFYISQAVSTDDWYAVPFGLTCVAISCTSSIGILEHYMTAWNKRNKR